ncbi:MAG: hypothetical protein ACRDJU_07085 [Actinomycetota bacterium]
MQELSKLTRDFLVVIHRPGWTTPVELALVDGGLESLQEIVTAASSSFKRLIAGAGMIGAGETTAA